MKHRLLQILIAADQLFNTLAGGWADETLSSRCYRKAILSTHPKKRWFIMYCLINAMFFDSAHCKTSYNNELRRKHLPLGMRSFTNKRK